MARTNTPMLATIAAIALALPGAAYAQVSNGNMEGGFYNTGWGTQCGVSTSKIPNNWGWNRSGGSVFDWTDSGTAHGGSYSARVRFCSGNSSGGGRKGIIWQDVYLGPNASYTYTVWARHDNGNLPSWMGWNPGQGQSNPDTAYANGRYQWVTTDNWGQVNQWVSRSMTVTADSAGYATILAGGAGHSGLSSGSSVYIDDVSMASQGCNPTAYPAGGAPTISNSSNTTINMGEYDNGGAGCAYSDADSPNNCGGYRTSEEVDACSATTVGWTAAGEWMLYSVNVANTGTYDLEVSYAAPSAVTNAFSIEMNGTNITSGLNTDLAASGGWGTYVTKRINGVTLSTSGNQHMKFNVVTAGYNVGTVTFIPVHNPVVSNVTISDSTLIADQTHQYTVTGTFTDANGAADITSVYILVNYQGDNAGSHRGYWSWATDIDAMGRHGGTSAWTTGSATGGGIYGWRNNGYGQDTYLELQSCTRGTSGNTLTVTWTFRVKAAYTSPTTNNDISGFARDTYNRADGWDNFDLNFAVQASATPTFVSGYIDGTTNLYANDSDQYTAVVKFNDANGADDIVNMRVLFDWTSYSRGYLVWGSTAAHLNMYAEGSHWQNHPSYNTCTGGGVWSFYTDDYGYQYITPVSASTSTSGNERTVNFVFKVKPQWAIDGPLTGNWVAGWASSTNYNNNSGWNTGSPTFNIITNQAPTISSVQVDSANWIRGNWYEVTVNFNDPDGSLDSNNSGSGWPGINIELVGPTGGALDTTIDASHGTTTSATNRYVMHHNEDSAISASCWERRPPTTWYNVPSSSEGNYLRGYQNASGWSRGAQGDAASNTWMKFVVRLDASAELGSWTARAFVRDAADAEVYADTTFSVVLPDPVLDDLTMSSSSLDADDSTQYTVTLKASDPNGVDNIEQMRVLFNIQDENGYLTEADRRGYLSWGKMMSDVEEFSTEVQGVASGSTCGSSAMIGQWSFEEEGYRAVAWTLDPDGKCDTASSITTSWSPPLGSKAVYAPGRVRPGSCSDDTVTFAQRTMNLTGITNLYAWFQFYFENTESDDRFKVRIGGDEREFGLQQQPGGWQWLDIGTSSGDYTGGENNSAALVEFRGKTNATNEPLVVDNLRLYGIGGCNGFWGFDEDGNGYQYISAVSCSTSTSGNQRTVTWTFTVKHQWCVDGPLTNADVSGWVRDDEDNGTGWVNYNKNYSVNCVNQPPEVVSVTPNSGTFNGDNMYTFSATYSDYDGWSDIFDTRLQINPTTGHSNDSLYVIYRDGSPSGVWGNNVWYMYDPDSASWVGPGTAGTDTILETAYGKVFMKYCSVSGSGNNLTVNYAVALNDVLQGSQNLILSACDQTPDTGGPSNESDVEDMGDVTLDTHGPGLVDPDDGISGPTQTVPTFTWSAVNGASGYYVATDVQQDVDDFEAPSDGDDWNERNSVDPALRTGLTYTGTERTVSGNHGGCHDGKYLWLSNSDVVYMYNEDGSSLIDTITGVDLYTGICWDTQNSRFWAVDWTPKEVVAFDRDFNEISGTRQYIGGQPIDIVSDGVYLYTNNRDGYIRRHVISPFSANEASINMDTLSGFDWGGQGITYWNGYLYAGTSTYGSNSGRIYKIDIRDFASPTIVGYATSGLTEIGSLATDGDFVYAATRNGTMRSFYTSSDSGWNCEYVNWPSGNIGGGRNWENSNNLEADQSSSYDTNDYPYMSISYKLDITDSVNILLNIEEVSGHGWVSITMTQDETATEYPKVASFNDSNGKMVQDNHWHQKVIDLDAQLDASLGTGTHTINAVIWHRNDATPTPGGVFKFDDFMIGNYTTNTQYLPSGAPVGDRTFYVRAVDAAGNLGVITSHDFEIVTPWTYVADLGFSVNDASTVMQDYENVIINDMIADPAGNIYVTANNNHNDNVGGTNYDGGMCIYPTSGGRVDINFRTAGYPGDVTGLVVGGDGYVYALQNWIQMEYPSGWNAAYGDSGRNTRILRIAPNGTISATDGYVPNPGNNGVDGQPIYRINGLATGTDGHLYFTRSGSGDDAGGWKRHFMWRKDQANHEIQQSWRAGNTDGFNEVSPRISNLIALEDNWLAIVGSGAMYNEVVDNSPGKWRLDSYRWRTTEDGWGRYTSDAGNPSWHTYARHRRDWITCLAYDPFNNHLWAAGRGRGDDRNNPFDNPRSNEMTLWSGDSQNVGLVTGVSSGPLGPTAMDSFYANTFSEENDAKQYWVSAMAIAMDEGEAWLAFGGESGYDRHLGKVVAYDPSSMGSSPGTGGGGWNSDTFRTPAFSEIGLVMDSYSHVSALKYMNGCMYAMAVSLNNGAMKLYRYSGCTPQTPAQISISSITVSPTTPTGRTSRGNDPESRGGKVVRPGDVLTIQFSASSGTLQNYPDVRVNGNAATRTSGSGAGPFTYTYTIQSGDVNSNTLIDDDDQDPNRYAMIYITGWDQYENKCQAYNDDWYIDKLSPELTALADTDVLLSDPAASYSVTLPDRLNTKNDIYNVRTSKYEHAYNDGNQGSTSTEGYNNVGESSSTLVVSQSPSIGTTLEVPLQSDVYDDTTPGEERWHGGRHGYSSGTADNVTLTAYDWAGNSASTTTRYRVYNNHPNITAFAPVTTPEEGEWTVGIGSSYDDEFNKMTIDGNDATDGHDLTWTIVTPPSQGSVRFYNSSTGEYDLTSRETTHTASGLQFAYQPDPEAEGDDTFTVMTSDGAAWSKQKIKVKIKGRPRVAKWEWLARHSGRWGDAGYYGYTIYEWNQDEENPNYPETNWLQTFIEPRRGNADSTRPQYNGFILRATFSHKMDESTTLLETSSITVTDSESVTYVPVDVVMHNEDAGGGQMRGKCDIVFKPYLNENVCDSDDHCIGDVKQVEFNLNESMFKNQYGSAMETESLDGTCKARFLIGDIDRNGWVMSSDAGIIKTYNRHTWTSNPSGGAVQWDTEELWWKDLNCDAGVNLIDVALAWQSQGVNQDKCLPGHCP